jgi:hypothetical protein
MKLLGDWNWYLPRWLEWLPRRMSSQSLTHPQAGGFPQSRPLIRWSSPRARGNTPKPSRGSQTVTHPSLHQEKALCANWMKPNRVFGQPDEYRAGG